MFENMNSSFLKLETHTITNILCHQSTKLKLFKGQRVWDWLYRPVSQLFIDTRGKMQHVKNKTKLWNQTQTEALNNESVTFPTANLWRTEMIYSEHTHSGVRLFAVKDSPLFSSLFTKIELQRSLSTTPKYLPRLAACEVWVGLRLSRKTLHSRTTAELVFITSAFSLYVQVQDCISQKL